MMKGRNSNADETLLHGEMYK